MVKKKVIKKNSRISSKIKLNEEDKVSLKMLSKGAKLEDSIIAKVKKFLHLHVDNYESHHGRRIEGTLFFFNFLAIVLFIISTYTITGIWQEILRTSEIILISIFIIEYSIRLWVAKYKIKHIISVYSIIDLIAILPILGYFGNLIFFRVFRILRLFRMLRVLRFQRIFKSKDTMFGQLTDSQLVIIRIILTIFTIILIASGMIWTVENKVNPGQIGTIWDAMYFSIVTMSTVGYGDVTPLSSWGKVITIIMILSGLGLIPWQLGKLIKILFLEATKTKIKCPQCGLEVHDPDAVHCKICGKKLRKKEKL